MKILISKKDENFYTATLIDDNGKIIISSGHETVEEIENVFLPHCKSVLVRDDIEIEKENS